MASEDLQRATYLLISLTRQPVQNHMEYRTLTESGCSLEPFAESGCCLDLHDGDHGNNRICGYIISKLDMQDRHEHKPNITDVLRLQYSTFTSVFSSCASAPFVVFVAVVFLVVVGCGM